MSKSLSSQLYHAARDLGNVDAVTKGYKRGGVLGAGGGTAKRIVRRKVYAKTNGALGRMLRSLGLG